MVRGRHLPPAPPPACSGCGSRRDVGHYTARELDGTDPAALTLALCRSCLCDRGASWRWRYALAGRTMPESRDAA